MTEYETIYVTKTDLDDSERQTISDKIAKVWSGSDAQLLSEKDWGIKKLAYEVNKARRGHYHYINYLGNGKTVTELERNFRFDERVFRFMTVKLADVDDVSARVQLAKEKATRTSSASADKAEASAGGDSE